MFCTSHTGGFAASRVHIWSTLWKDVKQRLFKVRTWNAVDKSYTVMLMFSRYDVATHGIVNFLLTFSWAAFFVRSPCTSKGRWKSRINKMVYDVALTMLQKKNTFLRCAWFYCNERFVSVCDRISCLYCTVRNKNQQNVIFSSHENTKYVKKKEKEKKKKRRYKL